MSENLAEVIFYHSLEEDAITPQSMVSCLADKRKPIQNGGISDFYKKDLVPLQQYGGVGEENIPLRYHNFIDRIGSGIKESANRPGGFSGVFYPLSGVDLSSAVPLLKDDSVLITLDSEYPFGRGYRPDKTKASEQDRAELQRDAFEKATHGMHSVEMQRGGWGVAADLQLAGFNPEKGDQFKIVDERKSKVERDGPYSRPRRRMEAELVIDGKKIKWIHYQMVLAEDTLSENESNKEEIWQDLHKDLDMLFSRESLILSKAGMFGSVASKAVAKSGLARAGNYICMDVCRDPDQQIPGIPILTIALDQLSDISPQFDQKYIESHKMINPYINFGYQDNPRNIFLAKVL